MRNQKTALFSLITSRHFRLIAGLAAAILVFTLYHADLPGIGILICSWVAFTITYLIFSWIVIFSYHPTEVRSQASREDTTATFIFLFVLGAAVCSLAGIFLLLKSTPQQPNSNVVGMQVALSFVSVFSSWILVHTVFTLRYAHLFYGKSNKEDTNLTGAKGLQFPEEERPDYLDFAYFSFVLGMTFQVSDVQITSRHIRRLALLHGALSFLYNTLILALSINIISGIVSGK